MYNFLKGSCKHRYYQVLKIEQLLNYDHEITSCNKGFRYSDELVNSAFNEKNSDNSRSMNTPFIVERETNCCLVSNHVPFKDWTDHSILRSLWSFCIIKLASALRNPTDYLQLSHGHFTFDLQYMIVILVWEKL